MEDEHIIEGTADATFSQSLTGKSEGQIVTEKIGVKNHVQDSYDGGDGDEITVEIVGSDVFIDGVDGIKRTDLGMKETEVLDASNLLHNGEGDGPCSSMSEAKDFGNDRDGNELDESKAMPTSSLEAIEIMKMQSERPVMKDSVVDGDEKLITEENMVAPEPDVKHPIEREVTKEDEDFKENVANNDADGVAVAVSEVSPKLDSECPKNVVEVNSISEFSVEDIKDEKSVVSIGEKVVDAESSDVLETAGVHEHNGNSDELGQPYDGGSGKILEANEDKSFKSDEKVNSDDPPSTTSNEATTDQRDVIYSGEAMAGDTSNEKVEAVDSEVSLQALEQKETYSKANDYVNLPTEFNVENAEDIVEPMFIDDAGLHNIIEEDGSSQNNKEYMVEIPELSTVTGQVAEASNFESTDLIPDDALKTASENTEKEEDSASNIFLSDGVHTREPLATDLASHDNLNQNNGYHLLEGPTSESEAMNLDHQTEGATALETDNLNSANLMSATQTPKPSFKIGECIRRVATQLTGYTSSANENIIDGSLNDQSMRQSLAVSAESSSVDDMLSHLVQLACNPNQEKSKGIPEPMLTFFLAFRRSIHLNKRGRKRKASTSAGVTAEEFEFDDVKYSYWADRIVQNYSEEQLLMQNNNNENNVQLVPVDLGRYARRGPKPHSRKRYSTGSHPSETAEEEAAKRRKQETSPAELILNFAERNCVPSEINLNKIFRRFGPIMESETEVDVDCGRARVIFKRGSDAEVAHSSAEKFSIFGPVLVNYLIGYHPVISVKVLPIVVTQPQEGRPDYDGLALD